ncbi:putative membrane protein [Salmonella phage 38]|uniref:Putative membrane protein n=1 Tax=Salmonella phage 38 TaxID=1654891 RepID=A0A0N7CF46_9CAUD|nr:hypothetical protein SP38_245 [Salmonella phage 38]AKJ73847.1 putative membrane protein [Salmonella phage 38]
MFVYFRSLSLLAFFYWLFDILCPRFIKEEVAFVNHESQQDLWIPLCALSDVTESDEVGMVGTMRSFNLFGFALFPKLIGELHPYNPDEEVEA